LEASDVIGAADLRAPDRNGRETARAMGFELPDHRYSKACGCRLANCFAASELQDHLRLDAGPAERLTDDALGIRAVFAGDHRLSIEILEIYALATRPGMVVGDDQYASVMPQGDSVYLRMLLDPRQNCNVGVAVEQLLLYEPAVPH